MSRLLLETFVLFQDAEPFPEFFEVAVALYGKVPVRVHDVEIAERRFGATSAIRAETAAFLRQGAVNPLEESPAGDGDEERFLSHCPILDRSEQTSQCAYEHTRCRA